MTYKIHVFSIGKHTYLDGVNEWSWRLMSYGSGLHCTL